VDLTQLRYTSAVAEHGSFSAAARACGVTQPTISGSVAALEDELGVRLFERSTRRVALTPAGSALLPLAHAVLGAAEDLEREAAALKRPSHKRVRVGFSPLLGGPRLHLFFEPFVRKHRDVELVYKECLKADMEERLDAGAVDVVCGAHLDRSRNRGRRALYSEPLRWIPPGGEGPAGDRASLAEIASRRLAFTVDACGLAPTTRALFAKARLRLDEYAGRAMSYATLEEWADLGIGGAILPASHVRRARSLAIGAKGEHAEILYEAVWRKDLLVAEHVRAFVSYLAVVPKLARGLAPPEPP